MTTALSIGVHRPGSGLRVGNWYYTKGLQAIADEVDCLSAPLSPGHLLRLTEAETRRRFADWLRGAVAPRWHEGPLRAWVPLSLHPAGPGRLRNTHFAFRHAYRLSWPRLPRRHYDLAYIDNAYLGAVLEAVTVDTLVVRVPDIIQASAGEPLFEAWRRLLDRADLVVASSPSIQAQLADAFSVEARLIPNGVELSRFDGEHSVPPAYEGHAHNLLYVGAFDERVDPALLQKIADRFPETGLHLIGPAPARVRNNIQGSNVYWHGAKPPAEVPAWMQHADCGLIPFRLAGQEAFLEGLNSLKAYEYLASGTPVVSTDFAGVRGISPWVSTVNSVGEFMNELAYNLDHAVDAVEVKRTIKHCDWEERLKPYMEFLRERT